VRHVLIRIASFSFGIVRFDYSHLCIRPGSRLWPLSQRLNDGVADLIVSADHAEPADDTGNIALIYAMGEDRQA
jgi:hypothetical protein